MKKLAIDCRMINASGIGSVIKGLLPYFVNSSEFKCYLLGNTDEINKFLSDKVNGDLPIIMELKSKIYSIKEQFELILKIPKCDIFWSPHYNVPILPIRAKKRISMVCDVNHFAFFNRLNIKQKVYAKTIINLCTRIASVIITISEFSKNEIVKYTGTNPNKIKVFYLSGDKKFKIIEDKSELQKTRDLYKLPYKYLLYVGNVKPHKNIVNLIKAFRIVNEKHDDFKLVIVGKKEGFITGIDNIAGLIKSENLEDKVVFTGFVPDNDLVNIYNLANIFVFPSLYEGFGIPPIEAMAAGVPVVASNVSSIPEVCGEAANYVDPYSIDDIAKGINRVIEDKNLQQELIKKGFERIKVFSWEKAYSEIVDIFRK